MTSRHRLSLDRAAALLYADPRPEPLLRQLLASSAELVGAMAGSISMLSGDGRRYVKLAERGASCRLGQSFPADEGATGQVVARRRPVVLDRYDRIPRGHLDRGQAATAGAVVAVPIWWRGELVGAQVLFAGRPRRFTVAEIDDLERLTQLAAAGLSGLDAGAPSLSQLIRDRSRAPGVPAGARTAHPVRVDTVVTEVGEARAVSPSVAQVALDLVALAEQAAVARPGTAELHVAVVHRPTGLRLLVHDAHGAPTTGRSATTPDRSPDVAAWQELVDTAGGGVSVEHVPGWGTLLRADLAYADAGGRPAATPSPCTNREQQVLQLLAEGAGDKLIARELHISQGTVEKHVGAVLRKTAAPSRTAAVVRAMDRGWLTEPVRPDGD